MAPTTPESSRRDVMKAVGAGTVLAALGGSAVVGGRGGAVAGDGAASSEGEVPQSGSVHRVETLIGESTNPERPADFFYQPTGLHVQAGDVVRFEFVTPDHNVVSYHPAFGMRRRVPLGVDAVSSPLFGFRPESIPGDMVEPPAPMEGGTPTGTATDTPGGNVGETETPDEGSETGAVPDFWLLAFETPGVYDFLCSPHEVFGMAMRVVVGDETDAAFETVAPEALPEPRVGPTGLARLTLTDPALQPSTVVEQGSVPWEALEANQGGEATETPD